jgi:phosphate starvation-inducible protein PhoH
MTRLSRVVAVAISICFAAGPALGQGKTTLLLYSALEADQIKLHKQGFEQAHYPSIAVAHEVQFGFGSR